MNPELIASLIAVVRPVTSALTWVSVKLTRSLTISRADSIINLAIRPVDGVILAVTGDELSAALVIAWPETST